MAFSLKAWFLERKFFCCCLPVRFGVMVMSFLTWLLSGAASFLLWFEATSRHDPPLSSSVRIAFIVAAVVESALFLTSMIGFVGAIVRKQSFVQAYAYFTYFHFIINLVVGSYFLWIITHTVALDQIAVCTSDFQNDTDQNACKDVLNVGKGIFIGTIVFIWLIQLYGLLIITRYVHLIREDKKDMRSRLEYLAAAGIVKHNHYESFVSESNVGLLGGRGQHPGDLYTYQDSTSQPTVPEPISHPFVAGYEENQPTISSDVCSAAPFLLHPAASGAEASSYYLPAYDDEKSALSDKGSR